LTRTPLRIRAPLASRELGFPPLQGRKTFLVALMLDNLGTGLFVPFTVVYFLHATTLSVADIGLALSLASMVAVPGSFMVPAAIDRWGAQAVLVASFALGTGACLGYLITRNMFELFTFSLFGSVGTSVFWVSNRRVVTKITTGAERMQWFALSASVRNLTFGMGGIVGSLLLTLFSTAAYRVIVGLDALSYLVGGCLVMAWRMERSDSQSESSTAAARVLTGEDHIRDRAIAQLIRNKGYVRLLVVNFGFVVVSLSLDVILAAYIIRYLHEPSWMVGMLFGLNCFMVVIGQAPITSRTSGWSQMRSFRVSAALGALAFGVLGLALALPSELTLLVLGAGVIVYTVSQILEGPVMTSAVIDAVPASLHSEALTGYQLSWSAGMIAAPVTLATCLDVAPALPWILLILVCSGLGILVWRL
jgi:MFS family permease